MSVKLAMKTNNCGDITLKDENKLMTLSGWVATVRDLGGIIFIELRDRSGFFQLVADPKINKNVHDVFSKLKSEYVIQVEGNITKRPEETFNANLPTGEVEMYPERVEILSSAKTLPFVLEDENVNEDLRLKYRYLDLRRQERKNNLILRHKIVQAIRNYLNNEEFIEVETPILINTTPEGARDYLVPSRVHEGKFYALPQSPQIYKQLLMVAGFEKYYQIAKCFRDEDLRADRQPEFTQVDIELSFANQENVLEMTEGLLRDAFMQAGVEIETPFRRITYKEAMDKYGSDKPDTRFGLELFDITDIFENSSFEPILNVIKSGGTVRALKVPGIASYSRKEMDEIRNLAISFGAKGLAWITYMENGEVKSPMFKFLNEEQIESLKKRSNASLGDIVFFVADEPSVVFDVLGRLRLHFGKRLELIDYSKHDLLWVIDFPMFEFDKENNRYVSVHHPFTMVNPEDLDKMENNPKDARSIAYDVIYNGNELGGGSVRIHDSKIQQRAFKALGLTEEQMKTKFGFMLEAFQYGTPPHAGIALGLDRLVALLAKTNSIRDVIAFPKNSNAKCLMTDAPTYATDEQLKELHLKSTVKKTEKQL